MANRGKCPHCGKVLTTVRVEEVAIQPIASSRPALSCCCPSCNAILSISLDFSVLKPDYGIIVGGGKIGGS